MTVGFGVEVGPRKDEERRLPDKKFLREATEREDSRKRLPRISRFR